MTRCTCDHGPILHAYVPNTRRQYDTESRSRCLARECDCTAYEEDE